MYLHNIGGERSSEVKAGNLPQHAHENKNQGEGVRESEEVMR